MSNKKIILKIGMLIVLVVIVLPAFQVLAQEKPAVRDNSYTVLAPLPGIGDTDGGKTTLEEYLPAIFSLLISLAATAAIFMIVIGGFQYMSTDAIQKKEDGKNRIKNAIYSLIFILSSWLILHTINPKLLKFDLTIDKATTISTSLSEYEVGGDCTNCVQVDSTIPVKGGTGGELDQSLIPMVTKLSSELKKESVGWQITEGYPPTYPHESECHNNGTCFDANVINSTPTNIKKFYEATVESGLNATYEVSDAVAETTMQESLVNVGMSADIANRFVVINKKSSAPHFHIKK